MPTFDSAVVFQHVEKHYANFNLHPLTFTLPKGQILGLVGPNGAGKSTCIQLLMGFTSADAGNIELLGQPVPQCSAELKKDVAFVSEEMRLYGKFNLSWHMALLQKLYPSWNSAYAKQLANNFELNVNQPIADLSLGQRIKSVLLLALARKPKLLVLDEPSTGLDPIARHELTEQLMQVMLDEDNSVLFSSQFTQDVERLSDSIAFLDNGKLINHQDKESYLDRWRRIRISGPNGLIENPDIVFTNSFNDCHELIHTNFSDVTLSAWQAKGIDITDVTPMTLEEIFIYQVQLHRQVEGKQA